MRSCFMLTVAVLIAPFLVIWLGVVLAAMALTGTVFERPNSRRGEYAPKHQ